MAYVIKYLETNGIQLLTKLGLGTVVFIILYIITKKIVERTENKLNQNSTLGSEYAQKNSKLLGSVLFIILTILNILAVFEVIGFDVAIIMGAISLSFGFAMQGTIENLVSGIMIITHKKIQLGDSIEFLGTLKTLGTVEEINIRYTIIRSFDKRRIIIPNSVIAKTPIRIFKHEPIMRGEISFITPAHIPTQQTKELVLAIINEHKHTIFKEYSSVLVTGFNDQGISFKGYFFANPGAKKGYLSIQRELRKKIFDTFKKYGIGVPYKHLTINADIA